MKDRWTRDTYFDGKLRNSLVQMWPAVYVYRGGGWQYALVPSLAVIAWRQQVRYARCHLTPYCREK